MEEMKIALSGINLSHLLGEFHMPPIAFSDDQLHTVMRAAGVLNVADRDDFLRTVAHALAGRELGDGIVARVCAEA